MNETVPLKTTCRACQGEAYLPTGETFVLTGRTHNRVAPCQACNGEGTQLVWVDLYDFANMLAAIQAEKQPA